MKSVTGNPNEDVLREKAIQAGIVGIELAAFMSQCAHESNNFKYLEEIGNDSYFEKYELGTRTAEILGNTKPGDGKRYKGRGFIQITGRWNYWKASKETGFDILENPELAAEPNIAAEIAIWYWGYRVKPKVNNFTNVSEVTKPINSGLNGLKDRINKFKLFEQALLE